MYAGGRRGSHERTFRGSADRATRRFTSLQLERKQKRERFFTSHMVRRGAAEIRVGRHPSDDHKPVRATDWRKTKGNRLDYRQSNGLHLKSFFFAAVGSAFFWTTPMRESLDGLATPGFLELSNFPTFQLLNLS